MIRRLTLLSILLIIPSICAAATEGPNNGGTAADNAAIGNTSWVNTSNALGSDNAISSADMFNNRTSHYLVVTNFSFTIPSGATIDGIDAEIEVETDPSGGGDCPGYGNEYQIRIVKGGVIGSTELGAGASINQVDDAYTSYGGPSSLLGETWTATDINSSGFGFAYSALTTADDDCYVDVDNVRITVYYTEAVPDLHEWAMIFLVIGGVYFLYREGMLDGMVNQY